MRGGRKEGEKEEPSRKWQQCSNAAEVGEQAVATLGYDGGERNLCSRKGGQETSAASIQRWKRPSGRRLSLQKASRSHAGGVVLVEKRKCDALSKDYAARPKPIEPSEQEPQERNTKERSG
jgi:hypothetical protein